MDSDESDSESVQRPAMERHLSPPAELQEEAAGDADLTDLQDCSVVLDRLQVEDKALSKELEEKDDMKRRSGKSISRIPTFHKRPTNVGQTPEPPVPKKDSPVQAAPPPEKAESGGVEAPRLKPLEARETTLPHPSVHVPKLGFEPPAVFGSTEQAAAAAADDASIIASPWSWSLSESLLQSPSMTASPRPALRPKQDKSRTAETEAATTPDGLLPSVGSLGQKPLEDAAEKCGASIKGRFTPTASGDNDKSAEAFPTAVVSQVEDIMDEEPPWEKEPVNVAGLKGSVPSSDAESEADLPEEKSEGSVLWDATEIREPPINRSEFPDVAEKTANVDESTSTVAPEKQAEASSSSPTKGSGCCSFALLVFLPTTLLLLGGFGQHVWHYGLPTSVAQLTAQLELHWLEGVGLVPEPCSTDCRVHLVESIPVGLYESSPRPRKSIADSWLHLLHNANSSVHIAAFYFTLRGSDLEFADSSDSQGRKVFEHLKQLESKGVKLQIAVNSPQTSTQDTAALASTGAEVREVDLKAVTGGIVHTKLWVVDQKHFYVGSANMDWRSLSQVKEVGLSVENCSCLAQDADRIFGVYWSLSGSNNGSLPPYWPARLSALSSSENPLRLKFNGVPARVYLSSAPPQISARGRSDDLSTILSVINDAQKFVYISVMDYLPTSEFTEPLRLWPAIDSVLRSAACTRGVQVRLMVSCWQHSPASMFVFLQSLQVLNRHPLKCDIDVKVFTVPSTAEQMKIPFARVNHAKYMVTDRVVYIGTSNWSENYFTQTAGVGLVVNQTGSAVEQGQQTLQNQAEDLFLRDWRSTYASTLPVDDADVCPHRPH
ncbi:5'-3' exonuclease PLD3 isoform X2 [Mugil cephalus]|uniref:5'-3' exonuclease PLD3 isoform X2 n=1 Tax=Mugil cephalus TaxID=48193 RepID=UPI001FB77B91|nr:5'-3' exonuclease PLD3 isoform X2 [Mugil cephalus]